MIFIRCSLNSKLLRVKIENLKQKYLVEICYYLNNSIK